MLRNALTSFKPASQKIYKDKINLLLASVPIITGVLLYYFLGAWVYGSVMEQGQIFIKDYISEGTMGSIVYYIVAAILTIMLYFLINWTFVLLVSLIASPFNDMLSSRIEKMVKGKANDDLQKTVSNILAHIFATLFNEIKKIGLIIVLSILSLIFGYIPLLTPISVFIAILLLSVEFLDFSWSRHKLTFGQCLNDLRKNLIGYAFGGAFFFVIVSIPLINLIVSPLATSFFTLLWIKNNESIN